MMPYDFQRRSCKKSLNGLKPSHINGLAEGVGIPRKFPLTDRAQLAYSPARFPRRFLIDPDDPARFALRERPTAETSVASIARPEWSSPAMIPRRLKLHDSDPLVCSVVLTRSAAGGSVGTARPRIGEAPRTLAGVCGAF